MTNGESQAIAVADTYKGNISQLDKLKKLGEELIEFTEAVIMNESESRILDEAGDMCFLILHILHKQGISHSKINLTNLVMNASDKMEIRFHKEK